MKLSTKTVTMNPTVRKSSTMVMLTWGMRQRRPTMRDPVRMAAGRLRHSLLPCGWAEAFSVSALTFFCAWMRAPLRRRCRRRHAHQSEKMFTTAAQKATLAKMK